MDKIEVVYTSMTGGDADIWLWSEFVFTGSRSKRRGEARVALTADQRLIKLWSPFFFFGGFVAQRAQAQVQVSYCCTLLALYMDALQAYTYS